LYRIAVIIRAQRLHPTQLLHVGNEVREASPSTSLYAEVLNQSNEPLVIPSLRFDADTLIASDGIFFHF